MILVIDNRDSFTYNLAQTLLELGAEVRVERASRLDLNAVRTLAPSRVLLGPGPGRPEAAELNDTLIRQLRVPMLGVCLGHQSIATCLGGAVRAATALTHGQTTAIQHDGRGVFRGLPERFRATRYNSLAVDPSELPPELEVSARSEDGDVMGLRHTERPLEGVQFHPEAILSECGRELLANFLDRP